MSKIKNKLEEKAFGPAVFPREGRLPTEVSVVGDNYRRQAAEENLFCRQRDSSGKSQRFVCCYSMHISLFFDGTNNNDNNDTKKNHPSNIAKIFHASLQGPKAQKSGYYSYYMPGVGTPFPEVGELDYSEKGLKYATGGEDRINWALVSLADALHWELTRNRLLLDDCAEAVTKMSTWPTPLMSTLGPSNRRSVMTSLLAPLKARVPVAQPKVLGIKLFVYGFSRGAADRLCAIGKQWVLDVCGRHRKLRLIFRRMFIRMVGGLGSLVLLGCASAENKMVAGNIAAINHVEGTAINWFSVNGYRAHGGGGSSCCIIMPVKWRPGLKVDVEWEVDPDRFAKIKRKTIGFGFDEEAWARHKANFRQYRVTVDVPEWPGKKSCSLNVHFLTCNRVEVTTSCWVYGHQSYPIQEPLDMKEPAVCPN